MVSSTYSTGSWIGIVRSGSVIALDGRTDPAIVNHLWDFLGQAPTIHGVLNEVTESFGTGLTGMPDFAILVRSDRLHAILRGDISLVATSADGTDTVSGRDVTTWSERSLPLPDSLVLTLAQPGNSAEPLILPLSEAVVCLRSLSMGTPSVPSAMHHDGTLAAAPVPFAAEQEPFEPLIQEGPVHEPAPSLEVQPDLQEPAVHSALAETAVTETVNTETAEGADVDGAAGDHVGSAEDEDAYAVFAMAAEAADAEWNAQLAPVALVQEDAGAESDLNLTIRPYEEDESAASLAAHDSMADVAAEEPADAEGFDDGQDAETAEEPEGVVGTGDAAPSAEDAADSGFTINYDYLFGATVTQSVEAAAVRTDEEGQPVEQTPADAALPPLPAMPPAAGAAPVETAAQDDPAREAEGPPEDADSESLMIDSVPWARHEPEPGAQTPVAGLPASDAASDAADAPVDAPSDGSWDPDHDGQTIMRGEFNTELQAAAHVESRPPTGPMVLARMCPSGHANPPSRAVCSDCGTAINSEPREVGRPRLGTMHISSGEVVELDHSLIIGRQPSVSRVMGGAMPRLVQVQSSNGDISRSHVEVRLDGWDVLLVDLKATNGTVLVREGQPPRRLSQGEESILLNGDIAELGDGVSLLFDGLL